MAPAIFKSMTPVETTNAAALSNLMNSAQPSVRTARMSHLVLALFVRAVGLSTGIAVLTTAAMMLF